MKLIAPLTSAEVKNEWSYTSAVSVMRLRCGQGKRFLPFFIIKHFSCFIIHSYPARLCVDVTLHVFRALRVSRGHCSL